MADGGTILLEWLPCENVDEDCELEKIYKRKNPLLVVLPGLTGGSRSLYMSSTFIEAHKN